MRTCYPVLTFLLASLIFEAVDSFHLALSSRVESATRRSGAARWQQKASVFDHNVVLLHPIDASNKVELIRNETDQEQSMLIKRNKDASENAKSTLADFLLMAGGVANVLTFKTFGFYASMMTGNIMRLCMSLVELRL